LRDFSSLPGGGSWGVRQFRHWRTSDERTHWLLARADGEERGIHVLEAQGDDAPSSCGRLDGLDGLWEAEGEDIGPHALMLGRDRSSMVVGAGPRNPGEEAPGYGKVVWAELEGEGCDVEVGEVEVLSDAAPDVAADAPATWRRAPNQLDIVGP
jgi:hypothetical protein